MNFKTVIQHFMRFWLSLKWALKCKFFSRELLKSKLSQTESIKINNQQGKHVVIGGLLIYILGFLIGLASTGVALEDAGTSTEGPKHQQLEKMHVGKETGGYAFPVDSNIYYPGSKVTSESYALTETNVPGNLGNRFSFNRSKSTNSDPGDARSFSVSGKINVPVTFLRKIFLNNLGLNMIIIVGAFSMLAFSMIVLVFNALQVGMLVKGIYNSMGLKMAVILVLPHLVVEVISHILSLYLAYVILRELIVPVVICGKGIELNFIVAKKLLAYLIMILIVTFIGACVEIYVTPKLI